MKGFALVILLVLAMSVVSAATVEEILLTEPVLPGVYVYYNESPVAGAFTTVQLVLEDIEGSLSATILPNEFPSILPEDIGDTTYVILEWSVYVAEAGTRVLQLSGTTDLNVILSFNPITVDTEEDEVPVTYAEADQALLESLREAGYTGSLNEFTEQAQLGQTVPITKTTQTIETPEGSTRTNIITVDTTGYEQVQVIEIIPKEIAPTVADIAFSTKPIVIEEDPIVMWELSDLQEPVSYSVYGEDITGNTVVLATHAPSNKTFWLPLLLIPLVGIAIIFFARFSPKK
jgi:hypothetical protein